MSNYPDGDMHPLNPNSPHYREVVVGEFEYPAFNIKRLTDIQLDGVDSGDHPDYADAYICHAQIGGRDLDDDELDWLADNGGSELAQGMAFESLL